VDREWAFFHGSAALLLSGVSRMGDVKGFALGLALVVGLIASPLVTGKAAAKSHVSVGIGFGGPVYGAPYDTAPPVYYAPAPVYTPPTYVYPPYYPPQTVIVPSPRYYAPTRSWQGEDEDDDD
jgi:hypothetical protein